MKKSTILYSIAAIFIIIQFFQIDRSTPEISPQHDFIQTMNPPADIVNLLKVACYDCHSYQTTYPWYSNINPVGWWLKKHINEGRKHLNFSEWATFPTGKKDHKLEECYEEIQEGEMPLNSYTWTHADARLSAEQRNLLVQWFRSQRAQIKKPENNNDENGENKLEHKGDH